MLCRLRTPNFAIIDQGVPEISVRIHRHRTNYFSNIDNVEPYSFNRAEQRFKQFFWGIVSHRKYCVMIFPVVFRINNYSQVIGLRHTSVCRWVLYLFTFSISMQRKELLYYSTVIRSLRHRPNCAM